MRKDFNLQYLEKEFQQIGANIQTPIIAYLLGGGAMSFRGQKNATKDLDVLQKTLTS